MVLSALGLILTFPEEEDRIFRSDGRTDQGIGCFYTSFCLHRQVFFPCITKPIFLFLQVRWKKESLTNIFLFFFFFFFAIFLGC